MPSHRERMVAAYELGKTGYWQRDPNDPTTARRRAEQLYDDPRDRQAFVAGWASAHRDVLRGSSAKEGA
jgi:hypothetical protein